jgi:putative ABC transport system permease protein
VDPGQPVSKVATMREVVSASTAPRRLTMTVFAAFAAAALLLAAVGIYGVISASVTQRTREIGIRMALGAPRSGILQLVMARVVSLTLAGGAAGLVLTLALSRSLRGLLFGVAPTDPSTLLSVAALLFAVALLAAFLPARRALRVDPAVALRSE